MAGNTDIMTEQRRSHDDKRRAKIQLLSKRLDQVSIQRIRELANKLRSIDDAVTINKK